MAERTIEVPDGMRLGLSFSLMRPVGTERDDVPGLLRQLAEALESELPPDYEVDALAFERVDDLDENEERLPRIIVYISSID